MLTTESIPFPSNGESHAVLAQKDILALRKLSTGQETDADGQERASGAAEREQAALLDASLLALGMVVAGVLLSYQVLLEQRDALCAGETPSDPFCRQLMASLLTVAALCFFYRVAGATWAEAPERPAARWSFFSSLLVLLAAIIRLALLLEDRRLSLDSPLSSDSQPATEQSNAVQEEVEDTPAIG